jgi:predicted RNase H-like HicB family nuclease
MGQLLEWPEVVTEGRSLDDCRASLIDAAREMALAYKEMGKDIPVEPALFESLVVEVG